MTKNFTIKIRPASPILLTAEHASARIPRSFNNLGLTQRDRIGAKDLYDPGSLEILRSLEKKLQASYLYANVSRLVIDHNRILHGKNKGKNTFHSGALKSQLLTDHGDGEKIIDIPGNSFLKEKEFLREEKIRYDMYVEPYKRSGYDAAKKIMCTHKRILIVMIHSFFPVYHGDERKVDVGVLYARSRRIGKIIVNNLRTSSGLCIGDNEPWKMSDADGGIFGDLHMNNNVELVAFDINNKHLQTKKNIESMAKHVYRVLRNIDI